MTSFDNSYHTGRRSLTPDRTTTMRALAEQARRAPIRPHGADSALAIAALVTLGPIVAWLLLMLVTVGG